LIPRSQLTALILAAVICADSSGDRPLSFCYLWKDVEISNIEEGRPNSWLIGLKFCCLEVILFYEFNFTSKERFHAGRKTRFTLSNHSMKLS
jgi:hypothetical protein